jgi:hypothetical protein
MLEDETGLVEETARAMRELASTVTDAPPLRLAKRQGARAARPARPRRWTLWAVPLAAAAAVIALAVSLVGIKDLPHGRVPLQPGLVSPSVVGPPTYYVAPEATCTKTTCRTTSLVVGDTFTGATLATLQPPHGTAFGAVSGAADDRTFVTDTMGFPLNSKTQQVMWYLLKITPGSSSPARLTRLPIPATPTAAHLESVALSASGRQLAVTYQLGSQIPESGTPVTTVLRIYSMATGQLLHSWSTDRHVPFGLVDYFPNVQNNNQLSWVDGDSALAFTSSPDIPNASQFPTKDFAYATARVLNVAASGSDLIADSRVVWSTRLINSTTETACNTDTTPTLAASGKTVVCTNTKADQTGNDPNARVTWRMNWLAYQTSAPKVARTLYKAADTVSAHETGGASINLLWASASGSTLIIAWTPDTSDSRAAHFGVVSQGTFTPLPALPSGPFESLPGIAW